MSYNNQQATPLTMWVIWLAMIMGTFVIQLIIGPGFQLGDATAEVNTLFKVLPVSACLVSLTIRFFIIPHFKTQQQLPFMIIGMAMAEATVILGAIMIGSTYPTLSLMIFVMGVITMVFHAPTYLKA